MGRRHFARHEPGDDVEELQSRASADNDLLVREMAPFVAMVRSRLPRPTGHWPW